MEEIKSQEQYVLHRLEKFYSNPTNLEKIRCILNGESKLSLRLIDWFVTNYAKKFNTSFINSQNKYNIVYLSYKSHLKAYSKKMFDPFCRYKRIKFQNMDTTVGQLNFFEWIISDEILDYIYTNTEQIQKDMEQRLQSLNTTNKKQEKFQRNIVTSSGSYNVNTHTKQDYNTVANTSISLSSGYYPEWANQWFEQLLLSEQVWLTRLDPINPLSTQVIPVNVKKSSMTQKTSVNERLIDYTFDFDMSFDYINNIR